MLKVAMRMTQILIDAINNLSFHNGVLRIECVAIGADGKPHQSGTLVIPSAAAGQVLNALINGSKELEKKAREQASKPEPTNA